MRFSASLYDISSPMRKKRQHGTLAGDMEARGHFGELAGEVYAANDAAGGDVRALHQSAAIGERSLAEHIEMARLIHNLRQQEHARLEVVRAGRCHPARGDVCGDELPLP